MRKEWAGNKLEGRKKHALRNRSRQKQSAGGVNVVQQADSVLLEWCEKKIWNKTEEMHLLLNTHAVKCNELLIMWVFITTNKSIAIVV